MLRSRRLGPSWFRGRLTLFGNRIEAGTSPSATTAILRLRNRADEVLMTSESAIADSLHSPWRFPSRLE